MYNRPSIFPLHKKMYIKNVNFVHSFHVRFYVFGGHSSLPLLGGILQNRWLNPPMNTNTKSCVPTLQYRKIGTLPNSIVSQ